MRTSPPSLNTVAGITAAAFEAAVEDGLKLGRDKLVSIPTKELTQLIASFAGTFTVRLIITCLGTLLSSDDKTSLLLRMTEKLVKNPFRRGVDVLKIAMRIEPSTGCPEPREQVLHRVERYRDALRCFDEALQNADDAEKSTIHLFRALTSMGIPGAELEAAIHFDSFQKSCEAAAQILSSEAAREEKVALENESAAGRISAAKVTGLGGGSFSASSIGEGAMEKAGLVASARKHRNRYSELTVRVIQLQLAAKAASLLIGTIEPKG